MNGPLDPVALGDPLRSARHAVLGGAFRRGWEELDRAPAAAHATPEWLLLAAMARWRLGDFPWARSAAAQARDRFRAMGDTDGEMRAENVAAAGAFAVGDLDEAERGFQRALSLAKEVDDPLMAARCANNLGNVAFYRANHAAALSYYRRAIAGFERVAFWKGLAEGWLNTAVTLTDANALEDSRDAADRAVGMAEHAADRRILAQALIACGEADLALGDVELARARAEQAGQLAASEEDALTQADALRLLADAHRAAGDLGRALELASEAWQTVAVVQHPWTHAEVQRDLAEIFVALGQRDEAGRAFQRAAESFERLGATQRARAMRRRATRAF